MDPQLELIVEMLNQTRSDMNGGFSGIHERLDELNGRTRRNSEAIVSLDGRVLEIRDRGCSRADACDVTPTGPRKFNVKPYAITGGVVGGAFAAWEFITNLLGKK